MKGYKNSCSYMLLAFAICYITTTDIVTYYIPS